MGQSYLKNAALLTGADVLLRLAGMGLRIYLANALGGEGMGLYQLVLAVYALFVTLATAGVSVAATRLMAEELARSRAQARGMLVRLAGTGLLLGAVCCALYDRGGLLAGAAMQTAWTAWCKMASLFFWPRMKNLSIIPIRPRFRQDTDSHTVALKKYSRRLSIRCGLRYRRLASTTVRSTRMCSWMEGGCRSSRSAGVPGRRASRS